jgi:two-component system sensor histidine kinase UhpB
MSYTRNANFKKGLSKWIVRCLSLLLCTQSISQPAQYTKANPTVDSIIVTAAHYMDIKNYDTAQQLLLNAMPLADKLSYNIGSYFSRSYLAEIYYLNGLLDNALIVLVNARKYADLSGKNSFLADVENLIGLIKDEAGFKEEAIRHFKKSLELGGDFSANSVFNVSHRYQILGNLAQSYLSLQKLDSAKYFAGQSHDAARELASSRGKGIAAWVLANVAIREGKTDSAAVWFALAMNIGYQSADYELLSFTFPEYWQTLFHKTPKAAADSFTRFNQLLLNNNNKIGQLSAQLYLKKIAYVFKNNNALDKGAKYMFSYDSLHTVVDSTERMQRLKFFERLIEIERNLLQAEIENERKETALKNNKLIMIALSALLVLLALFVYLYFKFLSQKQYLKELRLRQRLSSDLHDNIGSSLSSISLYSEVARQKIISQPDSVRNVLDKISETTYETMAEIKDAIWFMKPTNQSFDDLINRIEHFASPICMEKDISFSIEKNDTKPFDKLSLFQRKNIYLIMKESINNALKYSKADAITIHVFVKYNWGEIAITDNGIGITATNTLGNGLNNIKTRAKEINGMLEIINAANGGVQIKLSFPLTIIGE